MGHTNLPYQGLHQHKLLHGFNTEPTVFPHLEDVTLPDTQVTNCQPEIFTVPTAIAEIQGFFPTSEKFGGSECDDNLT